MVKLGGLLVMTLLVVGCSGPYQPPTRSQNHPANPQAPAAPDPPRSDTLAYEQPTTQPSTAPAPVQRGDGQEGHMEMNSESHQQHEGMHE